MADAVLLKPVEEGGRSPGYLALLHHNHTLKVLVDAAWLQVGTDGYVGIVTRAVLRVVYASEALVEQVVETLVDVVGLAHEYSVTLNGRMPDGSNSVDLKIGIHKDNGTYRRHYTIIQTIVMLEISACKNFV